MNVFAPQCSTHRPPAPLAPCEKTPPGGPRTAPQWRFQGWLRVRRSWCAEAVPSESHTRIVAHARVTPSGARALQFTSEDAPGNGARTPPPPCPHSIVCQPPAPPPAEVRCVVRVNVWLTPTLPPPPSPKGGWFAFVGFLIPPPPRGCQRPFGPPPRGPTTPPTHRGGGGHKHVP